MKVFHLGDWWGWVEREYKNQSFHDARSLSLMVSEACTRKVCQYIVFLLLCVLRNFFCPTIFPNILIAFVSIVTIFFCSYSLSLSTGNTVFVTSLLLKVLPSTLYLVIIDYSNVSFLYEIN